jgi:NDP-mannose synthase
MKAVILAGGKGTRLRPYTTVIPKPLVPVGDKAVLEILLENLRICDIREVVLCVNHLAELIMAYFGDGRKYGLKIEYSMEDRPLSTVAPLKLLKNLPDDFLVMNGDLLTELNFGDFYRHHMDRNALLTVATYRRTVKIDFGVLEIDDCLNRATGFKEKPSYDFEVSMGVYGFNRRALELVPDNKSFGFDDLMRKMLEENELVNTYRYDGYWLDIGRPIDYEQANKDYDKLQVAHRISTMNLEKSPISIREPIRAA